MFYEQLHEFEAHENKSTDLKYTIRLFRNFKGHKLLSKLERDEREDFYNEL